MPLVKRDSPIEFDDFSSSKIQIEIPNRQREHGASATCLALMRPGVCLSGSDDKSVTVYDFYNRKQIQSFRKHELPISRVSYAPKVQKIISVSRDRQIIIWAEDATEPLLVIKGHSLPIRGLSVSPDNETICTGSRDNSIKLWNLRRGDQLLCKSITRNLVTHLKWSPTSNTIVQTSEDKHVRLWDSRSLQISQTFPNKQHIQVHCDISAGDVYVLTCSSGNSGNGCEATLWDTRKSAIVGEYRGHEETTVACTFLCPSTASVNGSNPNQIATISSDNTVRIWDQNSTECLTVANMAGTGSLNDIQDFGNDRYR